MFPSFYLAHEVFVKFKKISNLICLTQFKFGELMFPIFEPMLRFFENKDSFWKYTKYDVHNELVSYIQSVQESEHIIDYIV